MRRQQLILLKAYMSQQNRAIDIQRIVGVTDARHLDRRIMDMVIVKNRCTKIEALTLCAMDYLDMAMKLKAELEATKEELEEAGIELAERKAAHGEN